MNAVASLGTTNGRAATYLLKCWIGACALMFLVACGGGGGDSASAVPPNNPATSSTVLAIAPIPQQTEVWCWAATAEMVFRHYGLPNLNPAANYQCGVVAAYYGGQCAVNCFACVAPIGSMSQMQALINNYGLVANQYFPSRVLTSSLLFNALTSSQLVQEIDANRPVIAGISPAGYAYPNFSQHAVLIVGYDNSSPTFRVIVNDPFPYLAFPAPSPYVLAGGVLVRPGQYSVPYSAFVGLMNWANTIYNVR